MSKLERYDNCSGEYPIVWEFNYVEDIIHRKSDGFGDSEYSHTEKDVPNVAHIIAPTEALAQAAWQHKYGQYGDLYRYTSHRKLFVLDATIGVRKGAGEI